MWYTHTHTHTHTHVYIMEYYSVIKNDEILPFETTWIGLECVKLSKISYRKENNVCFYLYYVESKKQIK